MRTVVAVGVAGVIGALLRYFAGMFVHMWAIAGVFPLGTLLVNVVGCLALGWLAEFVGQKPSMPDWFRVGLGTGLIGSFTTFSTFSVEMVELVESGHWIFAILYIVSSLVGGLMAVRVGRAVGRKMVVPIREAVQ